MSNKPLGSAAGYTNYFEKPRLSKIRELFSSFIR